LSDYRRRFDPGEPVGPSLKERERQARANFDPRFRRAYGFKEQNFKRRWWDRHPRKFLFLFTTSFLGVFYHRLLYDAFLRTPTEEELFYAEARKQRMIDSGFWDHPIDYYRNLRKQRMIDSGFWDHPIDYYRNLRKKEQSEK